MKTFVVFALVHTIVMGTTRNNGGYKVRLGVPMDTDPASPGIPNDFSGDEIFMWKNGRSLWQHNRITFDEVKPTFNEADSMNRNPYTATTATRSSRPVSTSPTPNPSLTTRPAQPAPTTKSKLPTTIRSAPVPTPKIPSNPKTLPRTNRPGTTKAPQGKRSTKKFSHTTVIVDDENYPE